MKTLNFTFTIGIYFMFAIIIVDAARYSTNYRSKRYPCGQNELNQMDRLIASILPFDNPKVLPPERIEQIPQFCL